MLYTFMSVVVDTPDAPGAIGPYLQARLCGNVYCTSGNGAIDSKTNATPPMIEEQTRISLENMNNVIRAASFPKTDVIKCDVFLADINDFAKMNAIYAEFFGDYKPCRTCMQAGKLCAPFLFEIACVCIKP
jgi:2-iminobutanoate/2-iminopropanoate deaminase